MFQFLAMTKAGCRRSFPRHLLHRITTLAISALVVLIAQAIYTQRVSADQAQRPNIVLIMADDMGWGDSATYGHKLIQTPNLDRLASEGVKFTQCYSACGVCSPSRSSILTGRTPYRNGVYRQLSGLHEAHLRSSEITYPKLLKSIGY